MTAKHIVRTVVATLVGEFSLVVLTTVAQEVLVDGVDWQHSSNFDLTVGGLATLLAGVLTGIIASYIGGNNDPWPVRIISLLVVIETTYLIVADKAGNTLWFSIASSVSLIAAIWIGYYLLRKFRNTN